MKPKTSLRESLPVHLIRPPIKRMPQFVFSMMTGSENTAMMKSNAGLAKPVMALPNEGTIPRTGHRTAIIRAVTPSGSADVTHKATKASRRPMTITPSCASASLPGISIEPTMQIMAIAIPISRFPIGTLELSIFSSSLECEIPLHAQFVLFVHPLSTNCTFPLLVTVGSALPQRFGVCFDTPRRAAKLRQ